MSEPRPPRNRQIVASDDSTTEPPTDRRFLVLAGSLYIVGLAFAGSASLEGVFDGRSLLAVVAFSVGAIAWHRAYREERAP